MPRRLYKIIFAFFILLMPAVSVGQSRVDTLYSILNSGIKDTSLFENLLGYSQHFENNYPDTALKLYLETEKIILKVLDFAEKSAIKKKYKNLLLKYLADNFNNTGALYMSKSEIHQALEYDYKSLKIREAIKDKKGIGNSLNNIGVLNQYYFGNIPLALENYARALSLFREAGFAEGEAVLLHNMAACYKLQGDTSKSLNFYFQSLSLRKKINNEKGVSDALNNISIILREKGETDSAINCGLKSLEIRNSLNDNCGISYSLWNLGECYFSKNDLRSAMGYGEQALWKARKFGYIEVTSISSDLLYKIFLAQGKWKDALEMYKLNVQMRDSSRNRENRIFAVSRQVKYEYEKQALADSLNFVAAQHEKDMKIERQKVSVRYLTGGIILLAILSFIAFRLYIQKKKTFFARKMMETELKALRSQMNPHFTFNVLNSIQYYAGENDMEAVQRYIHKFSSLIRLILEQSRSPLISLEQEITMLKLYLELEEMRFENKFTYTLEIDEALEPTKVLIPGMLIQPIVENAIKHGIQHKKGEAKISLSFILQGSVLVCSVSDNGIGRSEAEKIKDGKNSHRPAATLIMNERMEAMSSLFNIRLNCNTEDLYDDEGKPCGTKVTIQIPVAG